MSGQYIPSSRLTIDLTTSKLVGVMNSLGCTSVSSLTSIKQRVLKILSGQCIPMSDLTLELNRFHYSLGYTSVLSLKFAKQRVLKILSGQYIPYGQFDP
jgi:hypothetical protein